MVVMRNVQLRRRWIVILKLLSTIVMMVLLCSAEQSSLLTPMLRLQLATLPLLCTFLIYLIINLLINLIDIFFILTLSIVHWRIVTILFQMRSTFPITSATI